MQEDTTITLIKQSIQNFEERCGSFERYYSNHF